MSAPRKAPFSAFEKEYLKELIAPHAAVLESKKTDADFNKRKLALWVNITREYNNSPRCQEATTQQLKKLWLNMKAKARDAKSLEQQRKHTGGGPSIPDMAPEHESVLAMVPHIMPTIKVLQDSDGPGDEQNGDDDELAWQPKRARMKSLSPELIQQNPPPPSTTTDSRVPDLLPEHTPAFTSTPHTKPSKFTNKNNYNSIDALKIKLIENDIEHRNTKFKIDMEFQKKVNDLKYEMLFLEYEHKKTLYKLIEKEQEEKLKKASL